MQLAEGDESRAAGITAWLVSRDPEHLGKLAAQGKGQVEVRLDGRTVQLKDGLHFGLPH